MSSMREMKAGESKCVIVVDGVVRQVASRWGFYVDVFVG